MLPLAMDGDDLWIDFDSLESPLEEMFAWQMKRTKLGLKGVFVQVPIAGYRVDFLIQHKGRSIVVELDGKAYHDKQRDFKRDSRLIGHVDEIIRIPYAAMINENAAMTGISHWHDRFAVPVERSTAGFFEAMAEYRESKREDMSEWDWMQVYKVNPHSIYVGTLKQIAMIHNISPITRMTKKAKRCQE